MMIKKGCLKSDLIMIPLVSSWVFGCAKEKQEPSPQASHKQASKKPSPQHWWHVWYSCSSSHLRTEDIPHQERESRALWVSHQSSWRFVAGLDGWFNPGHKAVNRCLSSMTVDESWILLRWTWIDAGEGSFENGVVQARFVGMGINWVGKVC